jgi:hypothetical protein
MRKKDKAGSAKQDFYTSLEDFVKELHGDGTVERWEGQRKMAAVERNRRKLNRKIKLEKIIQDYLKG